MAICKSFFWRTVYLGPLLFLKLDFFGVPWWLSELRTWHWHYYGPGHCYDTYLIPGLRNFAWYRCGKKKKMDFFIFAVECMSSLHTLDITPLSDIWPTNISSHPIGHLFKLFFPFMYRSSLIWHSPTCLFFAFIACIFGVLSKKSLPRPMLGFFFSCFL